LGFLRLDSGNILLYSIVVRHVVRRHIANFWDMLNILDLVCRLYTAILRLYPHSFQQDYAEEMLGVFVEALTEARKRNTTTLLSVVYRELRDLPVNLVREYQHVLAHREGIMKESIEASGNADRCISQVHINYLPTPWWQAVLAGLPHLLYPLSIEVPSLVRVLTTLSVSFYFLRNIFWVLVVVAIVFGWRRKWPRWSASWVGYGLLLVFDVTLNTAQSYYGALLENLVVLIWLVLTAAVFFWMARRDWLSGLLVVLPVAPMFLTYIGLDGVKGTVPEALYFIAVGLLLMLVVIAIVRTGNLRAGIWLVLAAFIVITLPLSYATTYHSNVPVRFAYVPTVSDMVRTFLISVIVFVIFTAPLWSLALWTKGRRLLARNKAV